MTVEEQFKSEILRRYKSVRAFTQAINVPYSTIDTMLKKGIGGTSVQTVLKVCSALDIDIESIESGHLYKKTAPISAEADTEAAIEVKLFNLLSENGYIQEGGDISDDDLEFFQSLLSLARTYMNQRRKNSK